MAKKTNELDVYFRKSKRVVLRPLLESDYVILMKWINDPEVQQYLGSYLPMMEADEKEWIKSLHGRKATNIVVMIVVDGKPIGTMGIHSIDYRHGTATTGAMIGEKEYWGKGYGSEAKMLLLEYAFNVLNLRKIYSDVIAFNKRSVRYSLRCGYKIEARLKKHLFSRGKYRDQVTLSVFKKDWKPYWKQFAKEQEGFLMI